MSALVTGSAGFIGRAYCRKYPDSIGVDIKTGLNVLSLVRGEVIQKSFDGIVHLAAESGILQCNERPYFATENNIMGTTAMLELARRKNKNIVIASSAAADDPVNPYAATKLAGEALAIAYHKTYGVEYACLRFANVYGPDSNDKSSVVAKMCKDALREGVVTIYGDGSQRRDFVYIDDIVEAIHLALTDDKYRGLWSVGTGVMVSIFELAEYISDITGCRIQKKDSPRKETTPAKPEGNKLVATINWQAGVSKTLEWYREQV